MGFRVDAEQVLEDGSRVQYKIRRERGSHGEISRVGRLLAPDGFVREMWHEVIWPDGTISHRHALPIVRRDRA